MEDQRWSPLAYDADDLKGAIEAASKALKDLLHTGPSPSLFYTADTRLPKLCQGDVLYGEAKIPYINGFGKAATVPNISNYWLVTGNTCDYSREEVAFTQICPVIDLHNHGIASKISSIVNYETSRTFYLPNWGQVTPQNAAADLTMSVAIKKEAIEKCFSRHASMTRSAWTLLNCCLVRFLARDDGRFDP